MYCLLFLGIIKDKISNATFADILPFLIGIVLGFMLCLLSYFLILLTSIKKEEEKAKKVVIKVDNEVIQNKIDNAKNQYKEEATSVGTNEKMMVLKDTCFQMIEDIAKVYYPESKHPIYELSVSELMQLDYYIMERLEKIFNKKIISKMKSLRISSILNILDKKKQVEEAKIVKAAKKAHVTGIAKGVMSALNFINPVYWVKKVMFDVSLQAILNKMALMVIDIIGEETSNVYSKGAFVHKDDEIIEKELDDLIGGEDNE